jgi:beta-1,4-mannosyltransferase
VREELGVAPETFVFLCFGEIRAYKGMDRLLAGFEAADLGDDVALVIAGRPVDDASAAAVTEAAARDPRIRPLVGFVPDERVTELFDACDAAVLARKPGTSGSLLLALSLDTPVVAPAAPAYDELLAGGKAGWLFGPGGLGDALREAASDPAAAREKAAAAGAVADTLGWPGIAARVAVALRAQPPKRRRRRSSSSATNSGARQATHGP